MNTQVRDESALADILSEKALVLVLGDIHANATTGLCPPQVLLDDGSLHTANNDQRWLHDCWLKYWGDSVTYARRHDLPIVTMINGEGTDMNKHSKAQLITTVESSALNLALAALEEVDIHSDVVFMIRGTEAHSGASSTLDEQLGQQLRAAREPRTMAYSWWHLLCEIGGVRFDVAHHPGASSKRDTTKGNEANLIASATKTAYADVGEPLPHIVLRAHNHKFADSGLNQPVRAIINYSWKLTDAFGYRIGSGRHFLPVGGLLFHCEAGEYELMTRAYSKPPQLYPIWTSERFVSRRTEAAHG